MKSILWSVGKSLFLPFVGFLSGALKYALVYLFYRFINSYIAIGFSWAMKRFSDVSLSDATMQFTGLAAWIFNVMNIKDIISLLISFFITKYIVGFVKK